MSSIDFAIYIELADEQQARHVRDLLDKQYYIGYVNTGDEVREAFAELGFSDDALLQLNDACYAFNHYELKQQQSRVILSGHISFHGGWGPIINGMKSLMVMPCGRLYGVTISDFDGSKNYYSARDGILYGCFDVPLSSDTNAWQEFANSAPPTSAAETVALLEAAGKLNEDMTKYYVARKLSEEEMQAIFGNKNNSKPA